jgi:hypothetical protein
VKADRTECLRLFKLIKAAPESGMLKALANVISNDDTDLNELVFVLRTDARVLASMEKLVGMVAYTGPRNGGKSFINMRLVHFLGDHLGGLAKQVGGKYLSSSLRDDAEAAQPVTNTFRGKKLVNLKEFPGRPLQPETLKNLLDPQDGNVDARHHNNKPGDITSFPVTFVLTGCGNQSISVASIEGKDNGCGGKVHEMRTNYNLVADPDKTDPTQRLCDTTIPTRVRQGEFDGELFFWARVMCKTITNDVCKTRHMAPLPASLAVSEDVVSSKLVNDILKWFDLNTVACTREESSPCCDIIKLVGPDIKVGSIDSAVWSACGLGEKHRDTPTQCMLGVFNRGVPLPEFQNMQSAVV